jgi:hypothetical protein
MSKNALFLLDLIFIGCTIAFVIYRLQLISYFFRLFTRGSSKNKIDIYLEENKLNEFNNYDEFQYNLVLPPDFQKLRVVKSNNLIRYFFVNKGGNIYNLKPEPLGTFTLFIIPADKIMSNDSGCLQFDISNYQSDQGLKFNLFYTNHESLPQKDAYIYLFTDESVRLV